MAHCHICIHMHVKILQSVSRVSCSWPNWCTVACSSACQKTWCLNKEVVDGWGYQDWAKRLLYGGQTAANTCRRKVKVCICYTWWKELHGYGYFTQFFSQTAQTVKVWEVVTKVWNETFPYFLFHSIKILIWC